MLSVLRRASGPVLAVLLLGLSRDAAAIFVQNRMLRIEELPIERLLANIERNAQGLSPADLARLTGRVHLLAYVRNVSALPVLQDPPHMVAEGRIAECPKGDGVPAPADGERCLQADLTMTPPRELPSAPLPARPGDPHLGAALTAYLRAQALDPANLRTRLALAFVYDQSQQQAKAREELRLIAEEGLRRIPAPRFGHRVSDGDLHVVLSEVVEHLERLASSPADRALAGRLKARLDAVPPEIVITPILVPLSSGEAPAATEDASVASKDHPDGSGRRDAIDRFERLVDRQSPVPFDFTGQGYPIRGGWLTPAAAWLVWDPRQTGAVDGGFQLFGSVTWMAFWTNGYQALGALDDDGDGRIAGGELAGLALWHDRNANGVSDPGEVQPLARYGIEALSYAHERAAADLWVSVAGVTFRGGRTAPSYDWVVRAADRRRPTH